METAPATDQATPKADEPRRRPGRPPGSKTRRTAGAAGPMMPTPPATESPALANLLGASSEPKAPNPAGGRPRAIDTKDAELRRILAATYAKAAAALQVVAVPAALLAGDAAAARLAAIGSALDANGADCAAALVEWSRTNPKLRRMLENIGQGSGAFAVILAHMPIFLAAVRTPAGLDAAAPAESEGFDGIAAVLNMANAMFAPEAAG